MLDKSDLIQLSELYWEHERQGSGYVDTLSVAYYTCEKVLNEGDVVVETPFGTIDGECDLNVADPIGLAERSQDVLR